MNIKSVSYPLDKSYINDFDAWKIYHSIRLHFNTISYDVEKYGFNNTKTYNWEKYKTVSTWEVNFANKWAKQFVYASDMQLAVGAHFFYNKPVGEWNTDPYGEDVLAVYTKLKQYVCSPKYFFDQDLLILKEKFKINILKVENNNIPKIYHLAHKGDISYETLSLIDRAISLTKYVDTKLQTLTWKAYRDTFIKYRPFVVTEMDEEYSKYIKEQLLTLKG